MGAVAPLKTGKLKLSHGIRKHSAARVNTDVALGVHLARVSCGGPSEHLCCSNITSRSRDSSDRGGTQPTTLNTKTG